MLCCMQAGYTCPLLPQAAGMSLKKPATGAPSAAVVLEADPPEDSSSALRSAGAAAAKQAHGGTSQAVMTKRAAAIASSGSTEESKAIVPRIRGSDRARLLPADTGAGGALSRKQRRALQRCGPARANFITGVHLAAELMPVACAHLTDPCETVTGQPCLVWGIVLHSQGRMHPPPFYSKRRDTFYNL